MSKKVTCPHCFGVGEVVVANYFDELTQSEIIEMDKCYLCKGSGKVTEKEEEIYLIKLNKSVHDTLHNEEDIENYN